jgi:hypothetical protein
VVGKAKAHEKLIQKVKHMPSKQKTKSDNYFTSMIAKVTITNTIQCLYRYPILSALFSSHLLCKISRHQQHNIIAKVATALQGQASDTPVRACMGAWGAAVV